MNAKTQAVCLQSTLARLLVLTALLPISPRALTAPAEPATNPVAGTAVTPPTVGPDFPAPESFYPIGPREQFIEGATVVHYCVDAQGKIAEAPTVEQSSGNADLDSGAVLVATAGSGHYKPALRNGTPVPGCSHVRIRFQIPEDPRWPSLAHREKQLNADLVHSMLALKADPAASPPSLPTSLGDLGSIRKDAEQWNELVKKVVALLSTYIAGMDGLADAPDATAADREAFRAYWKDERDFLVRGTHELDSSSHEVVASILQLADYLEHASPPLLTAAGLNRPTATQQADMEKMVDAGDAAMQRMEAVMRELEKHSEQTGEERTQ